MRTFLLCAALLLAGAFARADDAFYRIPVTRLKLTEGSLPAEDPSADYDYQRAYALTPYVVLDGPGEAYTGLEGSDRNVYWWEAEHALLVARAPEGQAVTGAAYIPAGDRSGLVKVRFTIDDTAASPDAREEFYRIKAAHYDTLRQSGSAGAAYFRHLVDKARAQSGESRPRQPEGFQDRHSYEDTYNLFTGGRAVSENLQLDRPLPVAEQEPAPAPEENLVALDTLQGITVAAFDWKSRLGEAAPALDALAPAIPHDQHAVFFPSFAAMDTILRHTTEDGVSLFRGMVDRAEDGGLVQRYEAQLGLSRDALTRLVGPRLIRSVAVTGSDPYFPSGTDVAVLFQPALAETLRALLLEQLQPKADAAGARWTSGERAGVAYEGAVNSDRSFCSYIAQVGDAVVVTNSLAQLDRLAAVVTGGDSIAGLDEYRFFRQRYPLGRAEESAFVFLSDATIRRWCGPRWRIAASRRVRAGAILADVQASYMPQLGSGLSERIPVRPETPMRTIGEVSIGPGGAASSVYGTWSFITPIAELELEQVTRDEARAYKRWRDTYQQNWSWAFDPIALSLEVGQDRLAADLSVIPLILRSEYNNWFNFTQGVSLEPGAGDPHEAIGQAVFAVNTKSGAMVQASTMAKMMAPDLDIDPLAWVGDHFSIYADPDPFWDDLLHATESRRFWREQVSRLPVALHVDVSSALSLTAFITAARSFIEQSAPDMTAWETRRHNEQAYVRVGLSEHAKAEQQAEFEGVPEEERPPANYFDQIAVYYAATPRALIVSLREDVLTRALDRLKSKGKQGDARPWPGSSMALRFSAEGVRVVQRQMRSDLQLQSWSNIHILNEWKRLFPDKDPVLVHRSVWGTTPVCPGGGSYVWNEPYQTMSSTVFGHPGEPSLPEQQVGPLQRVRAGEMGVSLEDKGLRARGSLELAPAK